MASSRLEMIGSHFTLLMQELSALVGRNLQATDKATRAVVPAIVSGLSVTLLALPGAVGFFEPLSQGGGDET